MNDHDLRRLLEELGSEEPPPPDDDFLDQLEYQLRAEVIANSPAPALAGAPWRLPFGIAAAAFTVVVGVAGVSVVMELPDRQVSAQLASVNGAQVIYPDGTIRAARNGMTIPEGSVVVVPAGGSAQIDGKKVDEGQAVEITDDGPTLVALEDVLAERGPASEQVAGPPEPTDELPHEFTVQQPAGPSTTASQTAGADTNEASRKSPPIKAPTTGPSTTAPAAPTTTAAVTPTTLPATGPPVTSSTPSTQPQTSTTPAPPSTDTTTSTIGQGQRPLVPPSTVPSLPDHVSPPPGGTTTTTTPDTGPAGGTDPQLSGSGDTVVPAGSTGGDVQPAGDIVPAGQTDSGQAAPADTGDGGSAEDLAAPAADATGGETGDGATA